MSANAQPHAERLDPEFWTRLDKLDTRQRHIQSSHDFARRRLDGIDPKVALEFRDAWLRYCEVVAELDQTTGEFETLRTSAS